MAPLETDNRGVERVAGAYALMLLAIISVGSFPVCSPAQDLQRITAVGERAILAEPVIATGAVRNSDVTVVEYFDYNCPFCRRLAPTLNQLLADDKKVALVYKDWPVLGEASVFASRCALAAQWQGKYFVAHDALLAGPRLSGVDQVLAILGGAGIDMKELKKDLTAHSKEITAALARNDAEAHALNLQGTPGILVGRTLVPGVADLKFFQALVAEARSKPE